MREGVDFSLTVDVEERMRAGQDPRLVFHGAVPPERAILSARLWTPTPVVPRWIRAKPTCRHRHLRGRNPAL
jgi:hypothetical protein